MSICHKCDNTVCVNDNYLFVGSQIDNNNDRHRKGRTPKGGYTGNAKLGDNDVLIIRALRFWCKNSYKDIADNYGVTISCIYAICKNKTFKHVRNVF